MQPKEPEPSLPALSDAVWAYPFLHCLSFDRQQVAKQKESRQTISPKGELYRIIKDWPIENKRMKAHHSRPSDQRSAAIASAFTDGNFSAYPLPGRTYMVRAGATF